ncbi:F-box domain-containing protein [Mycena venus]|uniref:F-box domain-containing protein n=1 Tax=Mycena venus TaxID=2733690 RepID=A0A8H6XMP3_9AGAR|nr:F-box domain-containing protein [Mycena venus]
MSAWNPALSISALPNELLVSIAAAGQEGRVPDLRPVFKSEWTLSHVSRHFRDVITGAPALWTLVEANLNANGSVEILRLYLERSGGCDISATLKHGWTAKGTERNLIAERLRQLVSQINRVWRLSIVLDSSHSVEVLLPFRDVAAPKLQYLEIIRDHIDYSRWDSVELFSAGAPELTFLKMDGFKPELPVPPWTASLTHLEFWGGQDGGDAGEDATVILSAITAKCLSLVHLYLDINWMDPSGCRFHIPPLKTLHISISDSEDEDYLLGIVDLFDTPALTKFIINNAFCEQIFEVFSAASFPHASFPALTSFSFVNGGPCPCQSGVPFSDSIPLPPLSLFPALSSITLINQCLTVTLVRDILAQPWPLKSVTLCPQDRTLDDVAAAVRDGIQSQLQCGHTPPTFRLSPPLFSFIGALEADGVDIEVFDPARIVSSFDWRSASIVWSSRTDAMFIESCT